MDMLMEYAVVIIYSVAALVLPLNEDYKFAGSYQDQYPLNAPQYPSSAPQYPSSAPQY
jgi:hypothetical protein